MGGDRWGQLGRSAGAFASSMAAIAAACEQLAAGSGAVLPDDCYQGVSARALAGAHRGCWQVCRFAVTGTPGWIAACAESALIWLKSPPNPLLPAADRAVICCVACRKPGADKILATPFDQGPLLLGVDVSVQSMTKFFGGHSVLLGSMAAVDNAEHLATLRSARELASATPGALETLLAVRGIGT